MVRRGHCSRKRRDSALLRKLLFAENTTPQEESRKVGALLRAMAKLGFENDNNLLVRHFPETGRGLCVKNRVIQDGDDLIRLPLNCIISLYTVEEDSKFLKLFNLTMENPTEPDRLTADAWLALYIFYQWHSPTSDFLKAYMDLVPSAFPHMPYFCPKAELLALPEAVIQEVVKQDMQVKTSFKAMLKLLNDEVTCECGCGKTPYEIFNNFQRYRWAFFVVCTRSMTVDFTSQMLSLYPCGRYSNLLRFVNGTTNMGLGPFFDLFNHSSDVHTKTDVQYNHFEERYEYVLSAEQGFHVKQYQQIFINYAPGPMGDVDWLCDYGILVAQNSTINYVPLTYNELMEYVKTTAQTRRIEIDSLKFKILQEKNFNKNLWLVHNEDSGMSYNLHVALNFLFCTHNSNRNEYLRVLYSDAVVFDCQDHLRQLIQWLRKRLYKSDAELKNLPQLSVAGGTARKYIEKTIMFIDMIEGIYCYEDTINQAVMTDDEEDDEEEDNDDDGMDIDNDVQEEQENVEEVVIISDESL